jgi:transcriptional regulator with XRE-family HTH domain
MKFEIDSAEQMGMLIRASRKAMKLRQDDVAGVLGVSENFLGKVERGGETVQWGKLLQVMQGLGLTVSVEAPEILADDIREVLLQTSNKKIAKTRRSVE